MNKNVVWGVVAIVIVGGLIWYAGSGPKEASGDTLKVGALLILSGDFAKYGERSRHAIELAVEEHNSNLKSGERRVEVIYEDTKAEPKTAVSAYEKLKSVDHVETVVGPLLQVEAAALAPLIYQDNIPVFSVAPIPIENRATKSNPLVVWPDPTLEAGQMAQYVKDQGDSSISVLGTQDSWENEVSSAFANKFTELGGQVLDKEVVLPSEKDVRLAVTRAIQKKPDAVFIGSYYKFYPYLKTLKELGFKGKLYSIEIDTYLVDEAGSLADGLQFISPDFYTVDFNQKFTTRYGEKPSLPAGQVYDAFNLMLDLFSKYKDKNSVVRAAESLQEYNGVSGKIEFTPDHRAVFPLSVFEIQNKQITKVK